MAIENPEEGQMVGVPQRVHPDPEEEVEPELHRAAEGEPEEVGVEAEVADHIPTPVYCLVPRRQTAALIAANRAHHPSATAIPTAYSVGETRPKSTSTGNANMYRKG